MKICANEQTKIVYGIYDKNRKNLSNKFWILKNAFAEIKCLLVISEAQELNRIEQNVWV